MPLRFESNYGPIEAKHLYMSDVCEVRGQCAIEEYSESLRMSLEMWLEGRTNIKVRARYYDGGFWRVEGLE